MRQLGLLSLEIQRMPKDASKEFFHPNDAPYLSVVTPSTHDMSTIRGWWEEDRERIQKFYNHELGQWGEAPPYCEAWINKAIVIQHLYSPHVERVPLRSSWNGMSCCEEKIRMKTHQCSRQSKTLLANNKCCITIALLIHASQYGGASPH